MTKGQPYLLFMADSTREAMSGRVDDMVFVEEFEVRGPAGVGEDLVDRSGQLGSVRRREAEAAAREAAGRGRQAPGAKY